MYELSREIMSYIPSLTNHDINPFIVTLSFVALGDIGINYSAEQLLNF